MHLYEILLLITFAHYATSAPYPDEIEEMMKSLHTMCVAETAVDENLIIEANNKAAAIQSDDKLKCYMKCLLAQVGIISDDGVIDFDTLIGLAPAADQAGFTKTVETCKPEAVGGNACEVAFALNVCFKRSRPDKYMLI